MNSRCIALAADSAATVGHKIFTTDKIFELSRKQPIGIMIYGLATVSNVSLEVIIKEFRTYVNN